MNKEKILSIGALVLLVVAIGGYAIFGMKKSGISQKVVTEVASVAVVNGVAIPKTAFDAQLATATTTLKGQGVDVTDPAKLTEVKTQVLTDLINNELVTQEITKAGMKATPEQVEAQYQAVLAQVGGADKLKTQLAAANLSEPQLRQNIAKQLVIQSYLLQNIATSTVVVTDAEIKKFYDDNTKGQTNPPKLKDVTAQIKQQLTTNKQQLLVNDFLTKLRAKATITTSI